MMRYEGAAGHTLVVMDAGDGDVAFRVELDDDGDPDGDVILLPGQVSDLLKRMDNRGLGDQS